MFVRTNLETLPVSVAKNVGIRPIAAVIGRITSGLLVTRKNALTNVRASVHFFCGVGSQ
jgi:hypothetical protein